MKRPIAIVLLSLITALASLGACSSSAEAAPYLTRANCFRPGSSGNIGRQIGERNAKRMSQAIWSRLGQTCNQVDRLSQILTEMPLQRPIQGGEFSACFYLGYMDAMYDSIDNAYGRCGVACFDAGAGIGKLSAQAYCAASLAVGGLLDPGFIAQPPLPFCGSAIVMGCKTEYVMTAAYDFPGCQPFTEGYFGETFDNNVRLDCYVPADIPIRDDLSRYLY
jgi:hypothetical protein